MRRHINEHRRHERAGSVSARRLRRATLAPGADASGSFSFSTVARIVRPPRTGWTLIELLVVVSLTMVVAGSATVLMSKMLRASYVQANTLVRQRTLHLWEEQFREDGRQAQSATVIAEPPEKIGVTFQQAIGPVTYQAIPGGLERRVNGALGGRWQCGSGEWSFTLLDGDRIIRAEHRRAEEPSLSSQQPQGAPAVPQWTRNRVDVALGSYLGDK